METPWPQRPGNGHFDPDITRPGREARTLSDAELDGHIRTAWDDWCDLLDDLVSTGGMLPSRELARRVESFFEDRYPRAEDARVEALRRHIAAQGLRRCLMADPSRGIR